ncbi:MAG: hypothetical protein WCG25_09470 [bacterium]
MRDEGEAILRSPRSFHSLAMTGSPSGKSCILFKRNPFRYCLWGITFTRFIILESGSLFFEIESIACLYALTTAHT